MNGNTGGKTAAAPTKFSPAKVTAYAEPAGSVREKLVDERGLDLLNNRSVLACTRNVDYVGDEATQQYLAEANAAVDRRMEDPKSDLVQAITRNKRDNVRVVAEQFGASAALSVTSFSNKNGNIPIPDGFECRRFRMKAFVEGQGMSPYTIKK